MAYSPSLFFTLCLLLSTLKIGATLQEESMYNAVRSFGKIGYDTLRLTHKVVAQEADGSVKFGHGEGSAYLFDPDIYTDGGISVQGIDGVLFPPKPRRQEEHQSCCKALERGSRRERFLPSCPIIDLICPGEATTSSSEEPTVVFLVPLIKRRERYKVLAGGPLHSLSNPPAPGKVFARKGSGRDVRGVGLRGTQIR